MVGGSQALTIIDIVAPKQGHPIGVGDTVGIKDSVWLQAQDSGALGQILESNADKDDFMKIVVGDKHASLAGWHEAVLGMHKGGKRIAIFPPSLAYGAAGAPPTIPPKATLICEIEVIRLRRAQNTSAASAAPTAPSTPVHAGAAPAPAAAAAATVASTPLSQGSAAASISEADLAAAQKEQLLARLAMAGARDILGGGGLGATAAAAGGVPQIRQQLQPQPQPQLQGYGNALALYNPAQAQVQQPIYQPQVQPQPIYAAPAPQPVAPPPPQPQVNNNINNNKTMFTVKNFDLWISGSEFFVYFFLLLLR